MVTQDVFGRQKRKCSPFPPNELPDKRYLLSLLFLFFFFVFLIFFCTLRTLRSVTRSEA